MLASVDKLNRILIRLLQLVAINFLWLGTTIAGAGIFTIGPATYAMVCVMRKWLRSTDSFSLVRVFFYYMKESYRESLIISWIYLISGYILLVDLMNISNWYVRGAIYMIGAAYLLSLVYIFPIMAHYNWQGIFFKMKMAFLFGFSHLQYSLVLIIGLGSIYWAVMNTVPGILTFIGMSFLMFAITWMANQVFRRLEAKNADGVEHKSIYQLAKENLNEKKRFFKASKP